MGCLQCTAGCHRQRTSSRLPESAEPKHAAVHTDQKWGREPIRRRGRHLSGSRGRIARGLELIELRLRRLGCFGFRERSTPVPLELQPAAIGEVVLLACSRFIVRSAGRKEPPNPVSDTHAQHLRRQRSGSSRRRHAPGSFGCRRRTGLTLRETLEGLDSARPEPAVSSF